MIPIVQMRMLRLGDDRKFIQGPQLIRSRAKVCTLVVSFQRLYPPPCCTPYLYTVLPIAPTKLTSTQQSWPLPIAPTKLTSKCPCHVQCQLMAFAHATPLPANAHLPPGLSSTCPSGARTPSSMPCLCLQLTWHLHRASLFTCLFAHWAGGFLGLGLCLFHVCGT